MAYGKMLNNKGDPMTFKASDRFGRPWMIPILADEAMSMAVRKAAQIGLSTAQIFRTLHRCLRYRITYLYVLPTRDDIYEFSPQKVDPIIKLNSIPTGNQNTKEQKVIGKGDASSFLVFKGSYKEHEAIMIDADGLSYDEVDKCKPDVLTTYESRVGSSKYGWKDYFSTPTSPDAGINAIFERSDQKHWFIECPKCGEHHFMEWPKSVCYDREIYICKECGAALTDRDRAKGQWVSKWEDRDISGYWVNKLMCPWVSAPELIADEAKDRGYFLKFDMGLPWAGSDISVSEAVLFRALSDHVIPQGGMCMGLDTGAEHNYFIGNDQGIVEAGKLVYDRTDDRKGFDLATLKMREYDVRSCVVDGLPFTDEAYAFAREFPHKVSLCFYKERPLDVEPYEFNPVTYQVIADRQRTLDALIHDLYESKFLITMRADDPTFKEVVAHWKAMFLKTESDKYGQERRVWAAQGGKDHYCHAMNYWRMALLRDRATAPVNRVQPQTEGEGQTQAEKVLAMKLKALNPAERNVEYEKSLVLPGGREDFWGYE
jgi:DNA-directed RNA polymerase subunit RPC12/RpoP